MDDLSPEGLRQLFKQRAAADEERMAQDQRELYQGSETVELPDAEAGQRELLSTSFAKLGTSMRNIEHSLEMEIRHREAQYAKERDARLSLEAKLEAMYKAQIKVDRLRQRALAMIGLLTLSATVIFGILGLLLR